MSDHVGDCYLTEIEGRTFAICTERERDESSGVLSGRWRAWSFFAYDRSRNIFPADAIPKGVEAQESIAGESGDTEAQARRAVEDRLLKVISDKCLDGTGFFSPPGNLTYPQGLPDTE